MGQKDVFRDSEGDRYFERNRDRLASLGVAEDRVLASLRPLALQPRAILEIGCSNGWRLEALRQAYGAVCHGIDPSVRAVESGRAAFPHLTLHVGTADQLPFDAKSFDVVIFGFCLYLCDREDLFRIAAEADRVLREKGHLVVFDFFPPSPYRNPYAHRPGIYSYKMDYTGMFRWNPSYALIAHHLFPAVEGGSLDAPDDRLSVSILRKDSVSAFPDSPY
jgi:ubiquinone/menaquinone biosynthesis C-methylase UbiE